MSRGAGFGSSSGFTLSVLRVGRAGPEPEAVVSSFEDVAVMGEPIEQCCRHFGIAEHACPFAEAEVGGDDDAGLFVEPGEQVEQ